MTARIKITEDNIFSCLVGGSLILAAVLGLVSSFVYTPRFGASLFAGALLAVANFFWIRRGLEAALRLQPGNASRFAVLRFILRLAIMALLLYFLIVRLRVDIFGLVIGLSVLVLNIVGFSIYLSTRKGG